MAFIRGGGAEALIGAARRLRDRVELLRFGPPVTHVYNPLSYAWEGHLEYLSRYGAGRKNTVFLGMNPGPFGMVQTGVPFGEIPAVRDWLGIQVKVKLPLIQNERRPILGFDCPRCEVSGQRLWGLFAHRFGEPDTFFRDHFVLNYCPLAFLEETGRNRTPDKLALREREALYTVCGEHLRRAVEVLQPDWVIGIGDFAAKRAEESLGASVRIGKILHPSPASPLANRDWAGTATRQLQSLGVWT